MSLASLHPTLLSLEDTATPGVVRGVLSHVFDQLPEDARAREYGKILVDNAFNNVTALSLLDSQTLRFCEIPWLTVHSSYEHYQVTCLLL